MFNHLLFCAPGVAALSGEAITAYEDEGRYFLSTRQEDMNYFEKRSQRILEAASPLMNIYKKENEKQFYETQKDIIKQQADELKQRMRNNFV